MTHDRVHSEYGHELLVHHDDDELVEGTRTFVRQGLASSGHVVVHGPTDRVDAMRKVLGVHPRLTYGLEEDAYLAPTRALFGYQKLLAESPDPTVFWVTGPVPLGDDAAARGAWARYESAVDEALCAYPFRALCTYDTRTCPPSVISAAKATHATISDGVTSRANPEYVDPSAFLTHPLAQAPGPPSSPPSVDTSLMKLDELARTRHLLRASARSSSAASRHSFHAFLVAVHEVVVNGLVHGRPPVTVRLWAELGTLTCQVVDSGPGLPDPMAGYHRPDLSGSRGLWVARQFVDDLLIGPAPEGGCSVLLTRTDPGT
jgi:anti-sigma regulatory factor (Ser/Thr protein kinase)